MAFRRVWNARSFPLLAACIAAFTCGASLADGPNVTISNTPLPVTVTNAAIPVSGSVNANVSGAVNANVTNAVVPVAGTVSVASLPRVSLLVQPWVFREVNLASSDVKTVGIGGGDRFGVTTLTITNFDTTEQQLVMYGAYIAGDDCRDQPVISTTDPYVRVLLEPRKTIQLQFPSPMVFGPIGPTLSCIGAQLTTSLNPGGSVVVDIVGIGIRGQ